MECARRQLGSVQLERLLTKPTAAGLREYWFGDRMLSAEWFNEAFDRTVAALDERYHPEDHVDVQANQLFRALRGSRDWRDGHSRIVAALAGALPDQHHAASGETNWHRTVSGRRRRLRRD